MPTVVAVDAKGSAPGTPTDDVFVCPPPMTDEAKQQIATMRAKVDQMELSKPMADWLDDRCLYRYLRARQYNVDKAMALLENSVKWRQDFGVGKLMTEYQEDIKYLGTVGCNYVHGKDRFGRPVIYMKPRMQLKEAGTQKQQMRHLVYTLERAIWLMEGSVEKYVLIIDFNGYSLRTAPNISTQRETMSILQDQYVERLGMAVFVDAPFLFHQTFKLLRPFVDPITAKKLVFVSGNEKKAFFQANFDVDCLEKEYFGNDEHVYSAEQYFKTTPEILG